MRLADQQEMFFSENASPCLRYDLGNCLAPCASGCSSAQYAAHVRAARGFLGGTDLSSLARLEKAMTAAGAARRYEEAAVLRDQREALEKLHDQLQRFREAQQHYSFVYPVPGREGGCLWYLVRRGQVCLAIDEPHDRETSEECLAAIERIYVGGAPPVTQATREDVEMTLLVASWFRSRPDELQRTLPPEEVRERLRVSGVWTDVGRQCGSTVSGSCRTVIQRK
jgi:excinuclease ABC subunit C